MTFAEDMQKWALENKTTAALGAVALTATVFWFYTRRAKTPGASVRGEMPYAAPTAMMSGFRTGIQSTSIPYDARNYYTDFDGLGVPGDWW